MKKQTKLNCSDPDKGFVELFKKSKCLVLGEDHRSRAPIKLLMDNIGELKNAGLKYLFVEKFTHEGNFNGDYLEWLDYENHSLEMQKNIENDCKFLEGKRGLTEDKPKPYLYRRKEMFNNEVKSVVSLENKYSMSNFITTMHKARIMVVGVNSMKKDKEGVGVKIDMSSGEAFIKTSTEHSEYLNNYIIDTVIHNLDETIDLSKEKSIFLVGSAHACDLNYKLEKEGSYKVIRGLATRLSQRFNGNVPSVIIHEPELMKTSDSSTKFDQNGLYTFNENTMYHVWETENKVLNDIKDDLCLATNAILSLSVHEKKYSLNPPLAYKLGTQNTSSKKSVNKVSHEKEFEEDDDKPGLTR